MSMILLFSISKRKFFRIIRNQCMWTKNDSSLKVMEGDRKFEVILRNTWSFQEFFGVINLHYEARESQDDTLMVNSSSHHTFKQGQTYFSRTFFLLHFNALFAELCYSFFFEVEMWYWLYQWKVAVLNGILLEYTLLYCSCQFTRILLMLCFRNSLLALL